MTIRAFNKLKTSEIDTKPPGNHGDGGGLSLLVTDSGRSWVFRFTSPVTGKVRETGLGKAGAGGVSLAAARQERDRLRTLLRDGRDPLEDRRQTREAQRRRAAEDAGRKTVRQAADAYIAQKQFEWGTSSLASWRRFAARDIEPIAALSIDSIGLSEIKRAVLPLVDAGLLDTARGTQARLQTLLDYAGEHGWRPEDRRSRFSQIAPRPRKGEAPNHHPALMPDRDADAIRTVIARLRSSPSMSALALEFIVLTSVRVSEATGATWNEIDLDRALWTIPGRRMKMGREHVVPLSDRALAILVALHDARDSTSGGAPPSRLGRHVFTGARPMRPLVRNSVYDQCARVTEGRASPHGWRSSFRSWCSETGVAFEVAEACLAHAKSSIVAAYDRTSMIERRRVAMQAWAEWLAGPATAEVIPMAARRV